MAVNLINSSDIEVEQTGQDIQLKTSTPISTLEGGISDNTNNIQNIINGEKYLTTEVNTGKTWIDGKPIYRKVYTGTYSGSGIINISTPDLENIINSYGYIKSKYDNRHVPIPSIFITDSNYNDGISYFPNNKIEIRVGGAFSNISDYVLVVEYIKSS